MKKTTYDSKQLLSVLREVEQTLKMTIDTNCPNPGIKITQDLDNALNELPLFIFREN
jgi:hypothetical protein